MTIPCVTAVCLCAIAMTFLGCDDRTERAQVSSPRIVNPDPAVDHEIRKATDKSVKLMILYDEELRNAKSMKELHEAEQFYNWRVVPSQIERLKKESLKYSFEHDSSLSRLIGDIWE